MMSVHDAPQAWQQGSITTSRAMTMTGAADVLELYGLANACDVEVRLELTEAEAALVVRVAEASTIGFRRPGPVGNETRSAPGSADVGSKSNAPGVRAMWYQFDFAELMRFMK